MVAHRHQLIKQLKKDNMCRHLELILHHKMPYVNNNNNTVNNIIIIILLNQTSYLNNA